MKRLNEIETKQGENLRKINFAINRNHDYRWLKDLIDDLPKKKRDRYKIETVRRAGGLSHELAIDLKTRWE